MKNMSLHIKEAQQMLNKQDSWRQQEESNSSHTKGSLIRLIASL